MYKMTLEFYDNEFGLNVRRIYVSNNKDKLTSIYNMYTNKGTNFEDVDFYIEELTEIGSDVWLLNHEAVNVFE